MVRFLISEKKERAAINRVWVASHEEMSNCL